METLTVLYDADCALCVRCREWMLGQPAYVMLEFLPAATAEARRRYGVLPRLGEELIVAADDGRVWRGGRAFIVCLWALVAWREWSATLADGPFAPLAERFFVALSSNRRFLARWFHHRDCPDGTCRRPAPEGPYR